MTELVCIYLFLQLRIQVHERFDRLRQALDIREQILMRQVEALSSHQICRHMMIENIDFLTDTEFELLKKISNFGKFSIKHFLVKDDCLRAEEYISPKNDHVDECKVINPDMHHVPLGAAEHSAHHCDGIPSPPRGIHKPEVIEKSCIDLTTETGRHKIVKIREVESAHGKSKQNKQITIATTTQTSTQTEPPNHHHHRDAVAPHQNANGGLRESHSSTKHIETTAAHNCNGLPMPPPHHGDKVLKNISNLTLSNANGTINLRNISNVTINSACNRLKEHHCTTSVAAATEDSAPECSFYDRLVNDVIKENKQVQYQLVNKNGCGRKVTTRTITSPLSSLEHIQVETTGPDHKPVKFESNTTISNIDHPMGVQQWLKQIVYETETEPVINTEFLELVNIKH